MATIKDINHDSGSPLSGHWTTIVDAAPRATVTAGAALNSTANGVNIAFSSASPLILQEPFTNPASGQISLRFWFDPNGVVAPSAGTKQIARVLLNPNEYFSGESPLVEIYITITSAGVISTNYIYVTDVDTTDTPGDTITDAVHYFDMLCIRATGAATSDGSVAFYIDDVLSHSATGLDNYDKFATIDFIIAYFIALDAAQSGSTLYFDEVLLTDVAVISFSGYDLVLGGGIL